MPDQSCRPNVSVVIAAYRGERFIGQQLESILGQTLPPSQILIRDDSPDDLTEKAIAPFVAAHPGVIDYRRNSFRLGVSANFEKAIADAAGDFIFLSDQDDVWLPTKIETMTRLMLESPIPTGICCDSSIVNGELQRCDGSTHWQNRGFRAEELLSPERRLLAFLRRVPAAGHDMAFDARLKTLLLPFPQLSACHDTWIGLVLVSAGVMHCHPEALTLFRQHRNNLSKSGKRLSLLGQWHAARNSIRTRTFRWTASLFRSLLARVGDECSPETRELLEARLRFSSARARMDTGFLRRFPLILRTILNKGYSRFGRGWKNVVQDLFLRSPVD